MADTVPALLEPGEFVIRKDAANALGKSMLGMLNNADRIFGNEVPSLIELTQPTMNNRIQKFQHGGEVGSFGTTSNEDIYGQLGFEVPDESSEYQPAMLPYSNLGEQNLLSKARSSFDYSPAGENQFFSTGFGGVSGSEASLQRKSQTRNLFSGVAGLRQDYLDDFTASLYKDISSGVFEPTNSNTNSVNSASGFPTSPSNGDLYTDDAGAEWEWDGFTWVEVGGS